MTTARYLTPKGAPISRKGIAPDFVLEAKEGDARGSAGESAGVASDGQLGLAFDIVRAASITEHGSPVRAGGATG
jgi:hypothetical protein